MQVRSDSARARKAQRLVLELLQSDMPEASYTRDNELDTGRPGWASASRASRSAPAGGRPVAPGDRGQPRRLHPVHALRARLPRGAGQRRHRPGLARRARAIVFDMDDPMGASTCVGCGECVQACPTGALSPVVRDAAGQAVALPALPDRTVPSVCPYCGVGCQLTYHVKDNRIVRVDGRDGPANRGRLCVKGRYGFDYVHHPQRLTTPLIRRKDAPPKRGDFVLDPEHVMDVFREASWDEALDFAAGGLKAIRDSTAARRWPASARPRAATRRPTCSRSWCAPAFGSNNVDHCTRLCHASSVAALLEGIGSGAVSNPVMDVLQAEVIVVIGANPSVNHPVAATWIKNAVRAAPS
jgi:formate dehydrogenase major subunit